MISSDLEESTCPGCGARVVVAKNSDGKRVLLNPLPKADGYWYFGPRGHLVGVSDGKKGSTGLPLFVEHARTCPQRSLFLEAQK